MAAAKALDSQLCAAPTLPLIELFGFLQPLGFAQAHAGAAAVIGDQVNTACNKSELYVRLVLVAAPRSGRLGDSYVFTMQASLLRDLNGFQPFRHFTRSIFLALSKTSSITMMSHNKV